MADANSTLPPVVCQRDKRGHARLPIDVFVREWNQAECLADLCVRISCSMASVSNRAVRLRKAGHDLKRYQKSMIRHGYSHTRLYRIWAGMNSRCYSKAEPSYGDYGAIGIIVFEPWRLRFEVFREWALLNGYADTLTIDRRNGKGNYEPDNCRWATKREQSLNVCKRRGEYSSRFKGVQWNKQASKWLAQIKLHGVCHYLGLFVDEADAAHAYNAAAFREFGEFAWLNTIGEQQ